MRIIIAFLLVVLISNTSAAQDRVIINLNGSFEETELSSQADTLNIQGWTIETAQSASADFAIVSDTVKDGSRALRIDVNSLGTNAWDIQVINELFPVEPGILYNFDIWARANGTGTINFTAGNPSFNEFGRINNATITEEWQEFSFSFSVGANDSQGRTPLHFNLSGNEGLSFWIDSLRVSYESAEPEFEPIARDKPKFLGNVYSNLQIVRFNEYWNQVTPENAGKWGSVESSRDQMNWAELDAAYALAKSNGFPFRFHVLVWGNQQPTWMKSLSEEEQLAELEEWMMAVAERYPDIDYLEVVNEPLHDPPIDDPNDANSGGYYEALGGAGTTGWDWVITAFEMANEIFADSIKLMINDFNLLGNTTNAQTYLEIVELLIDRNLIDVIGAQGHHFSTKYANSSTITYTLDLFAETGFPIMVTELDINGPPNNASETTQLNEYKRVFPLIWEHESVLGVTLWGWRPGMWVSDAILIGANGEERLSLEWLREYVEQTEVSVVSNNFDSEMATPQGINLLQNYPNPFNPTTTINYTLSSNSQVSLKVFDLTGREIASLINELQTAGSYTINFDATNLSSGIYLYELRANGYHEIKKMTLIK